MKKNKVLSRIDAGQASQSSIPKNNAKKKLTKEEKKLAEEEAERKRQEEKRNLAIIRLVYKDLRATRADDDCRENRLSIKLLFQDVRKAVRGALAALKHEARRSGLDKGSVDCGALTRTSLNQTKWMELTAGVDERGFTLSLANVGKHVGMPEEETRLGIGYLYQRLLDKANPGERLGIGVDKIESEAKNTKLRKLEFIDCLPKVARWLTDENQPMHRRPVGWGSDKMKAALQFTNLLKELDPKKAWKACARCAPPEEIEKAPEPEAKSSFSLNAICKAKKFLKLRKGPSVEEMKKRLDDMWASLNIDVSSDEEEEPAAEVETGVDTEEVLEEEPKPPSNWKQGDPWPSDMGTPPAGWKIGDPWPSEKEGERDDDTNGSASKLPSFTEADIMEKMKTMLADLEAAIPDRVQSAVSEVARQIEVVEKVQSDLQKTQSDVQNTTSLCCDQIQAMQKTMVTQESFIGGNEDLAQHKADCLLLVNCNRKLVQDEMAEMKSSVGDELDAIRQQMLKHQAAIDSDVSAAQHILKYKDEVSNDVKQQLKDALEQTQTHQAEAIKAESDLQNVKSKLADVEASIPVKLDDAVSKVHEEIARLQKDLRDELSSTATKEALSKAIADFESRFEDVCNASLQKATGSSAASCADSAEAVAANPEVEAIDAKSEAEAEADDAKILCTLTVSDPVEVEFEAFQKLTEMLLATKEELINQQSEALKAESDRVVALESRFNKAFEETHATKIAAESDTKVLEQQVENLTSQVAKIQGVSDELEGLRNSVKEIQSAVPSDTLDSRMTAMEQAVIRSLPAATEATKVLEGFESRMAALEGSDVPKLAESIKDVVTKSELTNAVEAFESHLTKTVVEMEGRVPKVVEDSVANAAGQLAKVIMAEVEGGISGQGTQVNEEIIMKLESVSQKTDLIDARVQAVEGNLANVGPSGVSKAFQQELGNTSTENAELTCTVTVSDPGDAQPEGTVDAFQKFNEEINSRLAVLEGRINSGIEASQNAHSTGKVEGVFSPSGLNAFEEINVLERKVLAVETRLQESLACLQNDEQHVVSAAQQLLERRVSTVEAQVGSTCSPEALHKLEGRLSVVESSPALNTDPKVVATLEARVVAVEAWARLGAVNAEQRSEVIATDRSDSKSFQALESRIASVEVAAAKASKLGEALESRVVSVEARSRPVAIDDKTTSLIDPVNTDSKALQVLENRVSSVEVSKVDTTVLASLERRLGAIESSNGSTDGLSVTLKPLGFDAQAMQSLERRIVSLEKATSKTNGDPPIDPLALGSLENRVSTLELNRHSPASELNPGLERRLAVVEASLESATGSAAALPGSPIAASAVSALTVRVTALEVDVGKSRDKRRMDTMEEWIRGAIQQHESIERKLQGTEKRLARAVHAMEEPVEELAMGSLKMAQILGLTGDGEVQKREKTDWRDICFDLPRMLDHVWLRSRLPKKATFLKLLKQKVDSSALKELQDAHEDLAQQFLSISRADRVVASAGHPPPPPVPRAVSRIAGPAYDSSSPDAQVERHASEGAIYHPARTASPRPHSHRMAAPTDDSGDQASQAGAAHRPGSTYASRYRGFESAEGAQGIGHRYSGGGQTSSHVYEDGEPIAVRPPAAPRGTSPVPNARRVTGPSGVTRYVTSTAWGEGGTQS